MTVDRRLDLLTSELTAKERAVLVLRAWCQGEQADERLTRLCPPADKPEMDGIIRTFEQGTGHGHWSLVILLEWTASLEAEIEWLRILTAYQEREAALVAVARKPVKPLPPPSRAQRTVPIGWGTLRSHDDPDAETWPELREQVVVGIRRNLNVRWQEVRAYDVAYDEVAAALGEELMHREIRERLEWQRESVLKLHRQMAELGHRIELEEPTEAQLENTRAEFDWEVLRARPKEKHAREWMTPQQAEELEAWEREQAETVRSR